MAWLWHGRRSRRRPASPPAMLPPAQQSGPDASGVVEPQLRWWVGSTGASGLASAAVVRSLRAAAAHGDHPEPGP